MRGTCGRDSPSRDCADARWRNAYSRFRLGRAGDRRGGIHRGDQKGGDSGRPLRAEGIKREGVRDFLILNTVNFRKDSEVLADFEARIKDGPFKPAIPA